MSPTRRRPTGALLAIVLALLVGAGLRIVMIRTCSSFGSDSFHYLELANGLVANGTYESRGSQHPDLSRYPLYPALVALGMGLGASAERSSQVVSLMASMLLAVPVWFLGRSVFGKWTATAASAVVLLSCSAADARYSLPDPLAALLYLSTAAAAWSAGRRGNAARGALAGAFGGLASLCRAEGVLWGLAACVWLAARACAVRSRRRAAWTSAATCTFVFVACYAPYVSAVSAKLGRFSLSPGIDYVRTLRGVADHYGVRGFDLPGVQWQDRVLFLLNRERNGFVLTEHYADGSYPAVDPHWNSSPRAPQTDARVSDRQPADLLAIASRRARILGFTFAALPRTVWEAHLAPAVPLLLGTVGLFSAFRSRRGRRGLFFVIGIAALGLAPAASHLETRFLMTAFACGALIAARGWSTIHSLLSRRAAHAAPLGSLTHAAIAAGILLSTLSHVAVCARPLAEETLMREAGTHITEILPEGPLLSTLPHVPWFADRGYRKLPLGGVESVTAYFRAVEAAAIVINLPSDRKRRPDLGGLLENPPPPGFRLLARIEGEGGREVRVLAPDDRP